MSDEHALAPVSSQPDQPQKALARYSPSEDRVPGNQFAPLTVPQQTALNVLAAGGSARRAAREAKVDHRTVRRWIHENAQFAAACNARQTELIEAARRRVVDMLGAALATIDAAIRKGDVNAALHMVRHLGILQPQPPGHTDPQLLTRVERVRAARIEDRLEKTEKRYDLLPEEAPETLAELDASLASWLEARDFLIERDEDEWRLYLSTMHLTPEQCEQRGLTKPPGAPSCKRPSKAEIIAAQERQCARYNWDVKSNLLDYMQKGKEADAAARGCGADQKTRPDALPAPDAAGQKGDDGE